MKLLTILAALIISLSLNAQRPAKMIVDYVLKNEDGSGEVIVKRKLAYNTTGYSYYSCKFEVLPDSLKVGKVIYMMPGKDSCNVFKQIRFRNKNVKP